MQHSVYVSLHLRKLLNEIEYLILLRGLHRCNQRNAVKSSRRGGNIRFIVLVVTYLGDVGNSAIRYTQGNRINVQIRCATDLVSYNGFRALIYILLMHFLKSYKSPRFAPNSKLA